MYKILLHQIALFGLANRTKKVFPVFPRNIPYWARPKGPPFNFFSALRDFFAEKKFPKMSLVQFFCCFATEWLLENPRGPHFRFFGTVRFFSENKNPPFNFLLFCDRVDVEKPQIAPFQFFGTVRPLKKFFSPKGLQLRQNC